MQAIQKMTDKLAIGLSMLCTLHCLFLPLVIVLLPTVASIPLANENFHLWMVLAVIPTSLYALTMGCRQHQHYKLLMIGSIGIAFLITALLTETLLNGHPSSEWLEKTLTLGGALFIAYGHFRNYRLCNARQHQCDNC